MPQNISAIAVIIFLGFVGFVLGLSFFLGRKAKTAGGYFAAHGEIGWFVNGIAFAGDYLSAASFLGICGMIAMSGYDGFLYAIGFLAGWVVALFVIAEPIKRLGRFTFADALNAKFNSPGIRLAAAVSTLVVSMFYLIPQMVGAGVLLKTLLAFPTTSWANNWHGIDLFHAIGVLVVGGVVITIVTTAGMVSTTWVQFIKGSLLVVFCFGLVIAVLVRGISVNAPTDPAAKPPARAVASLDGGKSSTGAVSPAGFIQELSKAKIAKYAPSPTTKGSYDTGATVGSAYLLPGAGKFHGVRSKNFSEKLDFISLMLALFCGTASLPHILIRYYTVKDAAAARKSTVVGIISIGFFYVLTLYLGLGAMVSGNLNAADAAGNMAAPLLARAFGELPFALITGIAFTTVLGTVSGLIIASAGAVAHDLAGVLAKTPLQGSEQVRLAKIASVAIGIVAVILGIAAAKVNVAYLVGWAFNVAASANLPAIICLLFWRGTTKQGMIASILAGLGSSVIWLLVTDDAFHDLYGIAKTVPGWAPFSQPGLVTIPLAFIVLIVVSLVTKKRREPLAVAVA